MFSNNVFRTVRMMSLAALAATLSLAAHADDLTVTATLNQSAPLGAAGSLKGASSVHAAADPAVYSNVTNFLGTGYAQAGSVTNGAGNTQTSLAADDIQLSTSLPVNITGFGFSVVNFNTAAVSARPRLRFYLSDGTGGGPGTYLGGLNFNAISFPGGTVNTFNYNPGATLFSVPANSFFWVGETFDNNTGATGRNPRAAEQSGRGHLQSAHHRLQSGHFLPVHRGWRLHVKQSRRLLPVLQWRSRRELRLRLQWRCRHAGTGRGRAAHGLWRQRPRVAAPQSRPQINAVSSCRLQKSSRKSPALTKRRDAMRPVSFRHAKKTFAAPH